MQYIRNQVSQTIITYQIDRVKDRCVIDFTVDVGISMVAAGIVGRSWFGFENKIDFVTAACSNAAATILERSLLIPDQLLG